MPRTKPIPDRWADYTAFGERIPGTPFIPSKTPLSERLCSKLRSTALHYTPQNLVEEIRKTGHNVKMVINLTATDRYYDPEIFSRLNVDYVKIMVPGGPVPAIDFRMEFMEHVKAFKEHWNYSPDDEAAICVHCTHGVNRTGYFICKYLVNVEGWEAHEVIRQFEQCRGHKFTRQYLVDDILRSDPDEMIHS
ncbi:DSPc domain containing protein [Trichuris trichiura]|uniref:DSPc domain containing protein n=1 Tax=Trichuris trichiura TaxID=36087 RepID=A0A077Z4Y2_TRITR|nr:DSPc domain containing protein [Trichuris trichiura]